MKINYILQGDGKETVLFLHGWGANLNSFSFFSNNLKNNYKTLQIDFCGFGESDKLKYPFTVFDYALQVFKLIKSLKLNVINIVAHSFGVRVAILLLTMFNLNINKVVFIGGAGIKPKFNLLRCLKVKKYKLLKWLNKFKGFNFNLNKFGSFDYKNLNDIEKQTFVNVVNFNQKKYLTNIGNNTLLIWGNSDYETPIYMAKIFNKKIKLSTLKIIKNAGHFCFITHNKIVNFEITNFFMN